MGTNALMLSRWLQCGEEIVISVTCALASQYMTHTAHYYYRNISIQAQGGLWRGSLDLFID